MDLIICFPAMKIKLWDTFFPRIHCGSALELISVWHHVELQAMLPRGVYVSQTIL